MMPPSKRPFKQIIYRDKRARGPLGQRVFVGDGGVGTAAERGMAVFVAWDGGVGRAAEQVVAGDGGVGRAAERVVAGDGGVGDQRGSL